MGADSDSANHLVGLSSPFIALTHLHTMEEMRRKPDLRNQMNAWTSSPYQVDFHTPFIAAAAISADAHRRFQPTPTTLRLTDLNEAKVVVHVGAGNDFLKATSIEGLVIKRGGQVVKPISTRLTPTSIRNRLGNSKDIVEGDFTFEFSVFAPTSPITLVLIGPAVNTEIEIDQDVLRILR